MNLEEFDDMLSKPAPTGGDKPRRDFEVIKPGIYPVTIIAEQTKPTRAGDGEYLEITLQVDSGKYAGQRIWDRLNLKNRSTKAVEIALSTLSTIRRCCGIERMKSSEELVGHKLKVRTRIKNWNGKDSCEVQEYLSHTDTRDGGTPGIVNPQPGKEFGNDDYPF